MIELKTTEEIKRMREAGAVCAACMTEVLKAVEAGITTGELDRIAFDFIKKHHGEPSFLNYHGYPKSICASVNDVVVHGIPGKLKLKDGDIISIDMGVKLHGYHSDMARTVPVGKIPSETQRLIDVTKQSFFDGLECAVIGNHLNDVSQRIEFTIRAGGFSAVRDLVGHGIGREMHEAPDVPNFSSPRRGPRLKEGLVLAIEPMVNMGGCEVYQAEDGWTIHTDDGSLSAHYENTVAITKDGPQILTAL